LYRHTELVQDVTTFIIDIARNHLDSFFEEVLPGVIQNDLEYFRVINLIFRPILAREQSRVIIERTGTIGRWCQLAMALLNSPDINALLKTDCLNFLTNCWGTLPDYFESLQSFSENLIESLINLSQTDSVLHSICVFKLFELLEKFSKDRRKFAPEIYKALIFLLMGSDKNVAGRDRILQGFINLFLKTDIPSIVLLDSYLRHFQTNQGVTFDINVFDLDFLKFLVRDKKITVKFKIMFFDIFCKLMLGSLYGTSVFMELVAISQDLVAEMEIGIVMKFVDVGLKFYTTTYKNRKIVIGHVSDVQTIQMHKRALVCHYMIALLDALPLNSIQEQVKDAVLEAYLDVLSHYDKDKKKRKNDKGKIQGLREILGKFGDADMLIEKYMREKNIFFGSEEEVAKMKRSLSPGSKVNLNDLDPSEWQSLMSGDKSSLSTAVQLT
jgi:hypothetical protein